MRQIFNKFAPKKEKSASGTGSAVDTSPIKGKSPVSALKPLNTADEDQQHQEKLLDHLMIDYYRQRHNEKVQAAKLHQLMELMKSVHGEASGSWNSVTPFLAALAPRLLSLLQGVGDSPLADRWSHILDFLSPFRVATEQNPYGWECFELIVQLLTDEERAKEVEGLAAVCIQALKILTDLKPDILASNQNEKGIKEQELQAQLTTVQPTRRVSAEDDEDDEEGAFRIETVQDVPAQQPQDVQQLPAPVRKASRSEYDQSHVEYRVRCVVPILWKLVIAVVKFPVVPVFLVQAKSLSLIFQMISPVKLSPLRGLQQEIGMRCMLAMSAARPALQAKVIHELRAECLKHLLEVLKRPKEHSVVYVAKAYLVMHSLLVDSVETSGALLEWFQENSGYSILSSYVIWLGSFIQEERTIEGEKANEMLPDLPAVEPIDSPTSFPNEARFDVWEALSAPIKECYASSCLSFILQRMLDLTAFGIDKLVAPVDQLYLPQHLPPPSALEDETLRLRNIQPYTVLQTAFAHIPRARNEVLNGTLVIFSGHPDNFWLLKDLHPLAGYIDMFPHVNTDDRLLVVKLLDFIVKSAGCVPFQELTALVLVLKGVHVPNARTSIVVQVDEESVETALRVINSYLEFDQTYQDTFRETALIDLVAHHFEDLLQSLRLRRKEPVALLQNFRLYSLALDTVELFLQGNVHNSRLFRERGGAHSLCGLLSCVREKRFRMKALRLFYGRRAELDGEAYYVELLESAQLQKLPQSAETLSRVVRAEILRTLARMVRCRTGKQLWKGVAGIDCMFSVMSHLLGAFEDPAPSSPSRQGSPVFSALSHPSSSPAKLLPSRAEEMESAKPTRNDREESWAVLSAVFDVLRNSITAYPRNRHTLWESWRILMSAIESTGVMTVCKFLSENPVDYCRLTIQAFMDMATECTCQRGQELRPKASTLSSPQHQQPYNKRACMWDLFKFTSDEYDVSGLGITGGGNGPGDTGGGGSGVPTVPIICNTEAVVVLLHLVYHAQSDLHLQVFLALHWLLATSKRAGVTCNHNKLVEGGVLRVLLQKYGPIYLPVLNTTSANLSIRAATQGPGLTPSEALLFVIESLASHSCSVPDLHTLFSLLQPAALSRTLLRTLTLSHTNLPYQCKSFLEFECFSSYNNLTTAPNNSSLFGPPFTYTPPSVFTPTLNNPELLVGRESSKSSAGLGLLGTAGSVSSVSHFPSTITHNSGPAALSTSPPQRRGSGLPKRISAAPGSGASGTSGGTSTQSLAAWPLFGLPATSITLWINIHKVSPNPDPEEHEEDAYEEMMGYVDPLNNGGGGSHPTNNDNNRARSAVIVNKKENQQVVDASVPPLAIFSVLETLEDIDDAMIGSQPEDDDDVDDEYREGDPDDGFRQLQALQNKKTRVGLKSNASGVGMGPKKQKRKLGLSVEIRNKNSLVLRVEGNRIRSVDFRFIENKWHHLCITIKAEKSSFLVCSYVDGRRIDDWNLPALVIPAGNLSSSSPGVGSSSSLASTGLQVLLGGSPLTPDSTFISGVGTPTSNKLSTASGIVNTPACLSWWLANCYIWSTQLSPEEVRYLHFLGPADSGTWEITPSAKAGVTPPGSYPKTVGNPGLSPSTSSTAIASAPATASLGSTPNKKGVLKAGTTQTQVSSALAVPDKDKILFALSPNLSVEVKQLGEILAGPAGTGGGLADALQEGNLPNSSSGAPGTSVRTESMLAPFLGQSVDSGVQGAVTSNIPGGSPQQQFALHARASALMTLCEQTAPGTVLPNMVTCDDLASITLLLSPASSALISSAASVTSSTSASNNSAPYPAPSINSLGFPAAVALGGAHVVRTSFLPEVMRGIGGVNAILAMVQSAQGVEDLDAALLLLSEFLFHDARNLQEFARQDAYTILGSVLQEKARAHFTGSSPTIQHHSSCPSRESKDKLSSSDDICRECGGRTTGYLSEVTLDVLFSIAQGKPTLVQLAQSSHVGEHYLLAQGAFTLGKRPARNRGIAVGDAKDGRDQQQLNGLKLQAAAMAVRSLSGFNTGSFLCYQDGHGPFPVVVHRRKVHSLSETALPNYPVVRHTLLEYQDIWSQGSWALQRALMTKMYNLLTKVLTDRQRFNSMNIRQSFLNILTMSDIPPQVVTSVCGICEDVLLTEDCAEDWHHIASYLTMGLGNVENSPQLVYPFVSLPRSGFLLRNLGEVDDCDLSTFSPYPVPVQEEDGAPLIQMPPPPPVPSAVITAVSMLQTATTLVCRASQQGESAPSSGSQHVGGPNTGTSAVTAAQRVADVIADAMDLRWCSLFLWDNVHPMMVAAVLKLVWAFASSPRYRDSYFKTAVMMSPNAHHHHSNSSNASSTVSAASGVTANASASVANPPPLLSTPSLSSMLQPVTTGGSVNGPSGTGGASMVPSDVTTWLGGGLQTLCEWIRVAGGIHCNGAAYGAVIAVVSRRLHNGPEFDLHALLQDHIKGLYPPPVFVPTFLDDNLKMGSAKVGPPEGLSLLLTLLLENTRLVHSTRQQSLPSPFVVAPAQSLSAIARSNPKVIRILNAELTRNTRLIIDFLSVLYRQSESLQEYLTATGSLDMLAEIAHLHLSRATHLAYRSWSLSSVGSLASLGSASLGSASFGSISIGSHGRPSPDSDDESAPNEGKDQTDGEKERPSQTGGNGSGRMPTIATTDMERVREDCLATVDAVHNLICLMLMHSVVVATPPTVTQASSPTSNSVPMSPTNSGSQPPLSPTGSGLPSLTSMVTSPMEDFGKSFAREFPKEISKEFFVQFVREFSGQNSRLRRLLDLSPSDAARPDARAFQSRVLRDIISRLTLLLGTATPQALSFYTRLVVNLAYIMSFLVGTLDVGSLRNGHVRFPQGLTATELLDFFVLCVQTARVQLQHQGPTSHLHAFAQAASSALSSLAQQKDQQTTGKQKKDKTISDKEAWIVYMEQLTVRLVTLLVGDSTADTHEVSVVLQRFLASSPLVFGHGHLSKESCARVMVHLLRTLSLPSMSTDSHTRTAVFVLFSSLIRTQGPTVDEVMTTVVQSSFSSISLPPSPAPSPNPGFSGEFAISTKNFDPRFGIGIMGQSTDPYRLFEKWRVENQSGFQLMVESIATVAKPQLETEAKARLDHKNWVKHLRTQSLRRGGGAMSRSELQTRRVGQLRHAQFAEKERQERAKRERLHLKAQVDDGRQLAVDAFYRQFFEGGSHELSLRGTAVTSLSSTAVLPSSPVDHSIFDTLKTLGVPTHRKSLNFTEGPLRQRKKMELIDEEYYAYYRINLPKILTRLLTSKKDQLKAKESASSLSLAPSSPPDSTTLVPDGFSATGLGRLAVAKTKQGEELAEDDDWEGEEHKPLSSPSSTSPSKPQESDKAPSLSAKKASAPSSTGTVEEEEDDEEEEEDERPSEEQGEPEREDGERDGKDRPQDGLQSGSVRAGDTQAGGRSVDTLLVPSLQTRLTRGTTSGDATRTKLQEAIRARVARASTGASRGFTGASGQGLSAGVPIAQPVPGKPQTSPNSPPRTASPELPQSQDTDEGELQRMLEPEEDAIPDGVIPCFRIAGLDKHVAIAVLCTKNFYVVDNLKVTPTGVLACTPEEMAERGNPYAVDLVWRPKLSQGGEHAENADVDSEVDMEREVVVRVNKLAASTIAAIRSTITSSGDGIMPGTATLGGPVGDLDDEEAREGINSGFAVKHPFQKWAYRDIKQIYKRRYQLQRVGLEVFHSSGANLLLAFDSEPERDDLHQKLYSMELSITTSLVSSQSKPVANEKPSAPETIGRVKEWRKKVCNLWTTGELCNFGYLMALNALAGRSYNDLTQYPVFPWILQDYESPTLDLNDPAVYRDLSKPMGAIGEHRAQEFRDRFEAWEDPSGVIPKFHYGTHYSSAATVLYYLIRMEPFTRQAIQLQGGKFDHADRLFYDVRHTWNTASKEGGLSDVKELIPEFFYLPDFLSNSNRLDLGEHQKGGYVDDVALPPWSHGDPRIFVRINRCALESPHTSASLHNWIDLIFGYKQKGKEAIAAQNVFYFLTYEGELDINKISDPTEKAAMIAQINNFGQTPSQLFSKAHPRRKGGLSPSIARAPVLLRPQIAIHNNPRVPSVGDMLWFKNQLLTVERFRLIVPRSYQKYLSWGFLDCSLRLQVLVPSPRHRQVHQVLAVHSGLHDGQITCATTTEDSSLLITGGEDCVVNVWQVHRKYHYLSIKQTLTGHTGPISALVVCQSYSVIVSGSLDGSVCIWDMNRLRLLHRLPLHHSAITAIAVMPLTGEFVVCAGNNILIWTINADLVCVHTVSTWPVDTITALAVSQGPDAHINPIIVTGHQDGTLRFWSLDYLTESELSKVQSAAAEALEDGELKGSASSKSMLESSKKGWGDAGTLQRVMAVCTTILGGKDGMKHPPVDINNENKTQTVGSINKPISGISKYELLSKTPYMKLILENTRRMVHTTPITRLHTSPLAPACLWSASQASPSTAESQINIFSSPGSPPTAGSVGGMATVVQWVMDPDHLWVKGDDVKQCSCGTKFTTIQRRHHCRLCGGVFCGTCTQKRAPARALGYPKPVRVCNSCFEKPPKVRK